MQKGLQVQMKKAQPTRLPLQSISSPERKVPTTFCWQPACHLLDYELPEVTHGISIQADIDCFVSQQVLPAYSTQYQANVAPWLQPRIWCASGW